MGSELSMILSQASKIWDQIKRKKPLVHHITNFVAMAEQAHLTLAIGASPVMAPDSEESAQMAENADSLLLNIGTPSAQQLHAMLLAQESARNKAIPVLLDPVGYGATEFRNRVLLEILDNGPVSIIKGNHGEISALAGRSGTVKGVDSSLDDISGLANTVDYLSIKYNAVIVSTGKLDIIAYGNKTVSLSGGNPLLAGISGSGCWLGSIIASAAAASKNIFLAALSGMVALKLASEKVKTGSIGSFRIQLLDQLALLKGKDIEGKGDALAWI